MKIKGVIFDLDGTLGNTFPVIFPAYRYALAQYTERKFSNEDIISLFGPSEEGVLQQLIPEHWQDGLKAYEAVYRQISLSETQKFPAMEDIVRMLKRRGIAIAVVTGKGVNTANISLKDLGLAAYFDIVEGGAPEGVIKPACMRKIIARWGFQPREVAYVGDAPTDISDAKEVGALAIGAAWYENTNIDALKQQNPDELFNSLDGFRIWLDVAIQNQFGDMHLNGFHS